MESLKQPQEPLENPDVQNWDSLSEIPFNTESSKPLENSKDTDVSSEAQSSPEDSRLLEKLKDSRFLEKIKNFDERTQKLAQDKLIECKPHKVLYDRLIDNITKTFRPTLEHFPSCFSGSFTDEYVTMGATLLEGNYELIAEGIDEAYQMLDERITEDMPFEQQLAKVQATIDDYFGKLPDSIDAHERFDLYNYEEDGREDSMIALLGEFKGKNAAACTERAVLSQNLLRHIGIDSRYVEGIIHSETTGKTELHDYNLIAKNGKYYIFDSTIPSINEEHEKTPIITEITEDQYNALSYHNENSGYQMDPITVTHFNPLKNKEVTIHYGVDISPKQ